MRNLFLNMCRSCLSSARTLLMRVLLPAVGLVAVCDVSEAGFPVNERDFDKCLRGAMAGDTDAQWALGLLYIAQNTPESVALGIMWTTRAAEQGNSTAMFLLGLMYEYGRLVPKDETKAARLILQSALLGNAAAIQYIECGGKIMKD